MNISIALSLSAIIAYLIGSFNFAIIFSLLCKKQDIRQYGSKNAGMTNMIRVYGYLSGIPVFLGDFFKAIAAIYLCNFIFSDVRHFDIYGHLISGLFVVIGHLYPIYFKFCGGKGIATSAGMILVQNVKFFVIVVSVFVVVLIISKIVAVASVCAAISYPISALVFFENYITLIIAMIISSIVIYQHRANIRRLINKQY